MIEPIGQERWRVVRLVAPSSSQDIVRLAPPSPTVKRIRVIAAVSAAAVIAVFVVAAVNDVPVRAIESVADLIGPTT